MEITEINGNTPLALLTVDQFLKLQGQNEQPVSTVTNDFTADGKKYCFGLSGLAQLLHCSRPTAQTIKNSGKISYVQTGRKIVFDKEKVLKELSVNKKPLK